VDIKEKTGKTARLECHAEGSPPPEIAWKKDGGDDFPAARERRMHVMSNDHVFFIVDLKAADMGVYSCTAQNVAGVIVANATLTVLGNDFTTINHIHHYQSGRIDNVSKAIRVVSNIYILPSQIMSVTR